MEKHFQEKYDIKSHILSGFRMVWDVFKVLEYMYDLNFGLKEAELMFLPDARVR